MFSRISICMYVIILSSAYTCDLGAIPKVPGLKIGGTVDLRIDCSNWKAARAISRTVARHGFYELPGSNTKSSEGLYHDKAQRKVTIIARR